MSTGLSRESAGYPITPSVCGGRTKCAPVTSNDQGDVPCGLTWSIIAKCGSGSRF